VALHLVGEEDNDVPPLTNKSPPGGSSFCVDVNRPNHSHSLFRNQVFEFWPYRDQLGHNSIFVSTSLCPKLLSIPSH
jgi:hypothetical protein